MDQTTTDYATRIPMNSSPLNFGQPTCCKQRKSCSTCAGRSVGLKDYLSTHAETDRVALLRDVAVDLDRLHTADRLIHGQVNIDHVTVSPNGRSRLVQSTKTTAITEQPREPANAEEKLPATTATDVYAFAWLAFHVFTDIDPQELVRNDSKIMQLIASGVKPNRPGPNTLPTNRGLDDKIWAMCLRCWEISPIARPTMNEVIKAFESDATTSNANVSGAVPTVVIPSAGDMIEKPGGATLCIPRRERTHSLTIIMKPVYRTSYLVHAPRGWNNGSRALVSHVQADAPLLLGGPGLVGLMSIGVPFRSHESSSLGLTDTCNAVSHNVMSCVILLVSSAAVLAAI